MNAHEFLKSKGLIRPHYKDFIITFTDGESKDINVADLLDEYHAIASGLKVDVDKKFDNLIEKDYKGPEQKPME